MFGRRRRYVKNLFVCCSVAVLLLLGSVAVVGDDAPRSKNGGNVLHGYGGPLIKNGGNILHGYGGPQFKISSIAAQPCVFGGGPMMVYPEKHFGVGIVFNYLEADIDGLQMLYGGARGEYVFVPDFWLSPSVALVLGGGGVYTMEKGSAATGGREAVIPLPADSGAAGFLLIEPSVHLNLSILPCTQLSIGGAYRFAISPGGSGDGPTFTDLSAPTLVVQLKEGMFEDSRSIFFSSKGDDYAVEREARKQKPFSISGFYDSTFTWYRGTFARLDGGGTRFFFGDRFCIGASGRFLTTTVTLKERSFQTMETGIWTEYRFLQKAWFQLSVGGLTGVGMYGWLTEENEVDGGPGFLFSPSVFAGLRVTDFFIIGAGAGYRFVFGTDVEAADDLDFWGPTVSLQARFGMFY